MGSAESEAAGTVAGGKVLLIYTGGTIGSVPRDPADPASPLTPAPLDQVLAMLTRYDARNRRILLGRTWVELNTLSWDPPIDSANVTFGHWVRLAREIEERYDDYAGFVVLHGTDTLAFVASALAFMLDNLGKPVVLTGSQRPIGETRSDGAQNLVTAIEIAAASLVGGTAVPEVTVFFRDELYRGCRVTKVDASGYRAFASPNCPPLAVAGERIVVDARVVRPPSRHALVVKDRLESNIASLALFPGMSPELLDSLFRTPGLRGVVLETFGAGNAPTGPEFLRTIGDAVAAGIVVVDVTQCLSGAVELGLYDVSAGLLARGVIGGQDLTSEAALAKLAFVLGHEEDPRVARDVLEIDLRGEQSRSIFHLHWPGGEVAPGGSWSGPPEDDMVHGAYRYDPGRLERAMLRVLGVEVPGAELGVIGLKAYLDLPAATASTAEAGNPHFLGRASKEWSAVSGAESVFFPVTEPVRRYVDNRHEVELTLVATGPEPLRWSRISLACEADC